MRIAFDAKRAFQNHTGLGHYSRTLINELAKNFPHHEYYLMTPKPGKLFSSEGKQNMHTVYPEGIAKTFNALWRSNWIKKDLQKLEIDLYHGLSHEIPIGMQHTGIRSVVTMHDLIFERYPEQYKKLDVAIYRKKFMYACTHADKVIAISKQTKKDLIHFYKVPEQKISVCYQSCNPMFEQQVSSDEKQRIRQKYNLPDQFFLYVGSIIERKNLLTICKGLNLLKNELNIPLVVIGEGRKYAAKVHAYIQANDLRSQVIFLHDKGHFKDDSGFKTSVDFPAIYQLATAMIYPSIFEGFGLPVLEALWSRVPVITSNISCLPETGGDAALYIDPLDEQEMADAMLRIATDQELTRKMIVKGVAHAQQFKPEVCSAKVMEVYQSLF